MNATLTRRRILYTDADLIVVDKPSGLVSHATVDPTRDHLVAAVHRWFESHGTTVDHLVLHHRLDRETSGAVLLSRSAQFDAAIGAAFAERRVHKTYLAVAEIPPTATFPQGTTELRAYLAPGKGVGGRTLIVRAGGQPAVTHVRPLIRVGDLLLIEACPRTGRTHQIRVQLANMGFPILGDLLYGPPTRTTKRLMLHAAKLQLPHPRTGVPLCIQAPAPRAFRTRFAALARSRH